MFIAHLPAGWLLARRFDDRRARAAFLAGAVAPDLDLVWWYLIDGGAVHHHRYVEAKSRRGQPACRRKAFLAPPDGVGCEPDCWGRGEIGREMAKEGHDRRSSKDGVEVIGGTHSRVEIATMSSNSVVQERALEVVAEMCGALGFGEIMTTVEALALLEGPAQQQGVIGIAARFAKGRALSTWQGSKP